MGASTDTTGSQQDRHWPIGALYDNHVISAGVSASISSTYLNTTLDNPNPVSSSNFDPTPVTPLRLILHLAAPPTDKILSSPSVEACKQAFMGQIKEADFLRWGNTKRVTGLRKQEQDGIWDGLRDSKQLPVPCVCGLISALPRLLSISFVFLTTCRTPANGVL